jgi:carbon-monoxide dehydrogenase small subunit
MAKHLISLTINGDTYEDLVVSDNQTLLDVIRGEVGLKGTKRGCTTGACGVCTVNDANGDAILSCMTHVLEWDGEAITTIEGLADTSDLDAIQKAFVHYGAVQCGSCTPGVIMSAKALLNTHPQPTEEQINEAMAGVLCRCTGHVKVKEAIRNAHRIEEVVSHAAGD